jgi:hypothetical protein
MSLEFLSGIGANRKKSTTRTTARATARAQKKVAKKVQKIEKKALKKGKVNARQMRALEKKAPATASRLKKSIVKQIQRNKMEAEGEPAISPELPSVDEQVENEIIEEANQDIQEGTDEVNEPEFEGSGNPDSEEGGADMGVIYPNYYALSGKRKKNPARAQKKATRKATRKAKLKKFSNKAKKVGLAVPRKAILTLLGLGKKTEKLLKFNLTKKLATLWNSDNGAGLKAMWIKFGGNPDELKNAINKGSEVKVNGASLGVATEVIITSASPILLAIADLFLKYRKNRQAQGLPEETPEEETSEQIEEPEQMSGLNRMRINKLRAERLRQIINQ